MPPQPPIPESLRLYLSPLSLSHLNAYYALNSDERISRWSTRPPTKDLSEAEKLMLSRLPGPGKEFMENYAIMLKTPPHHSMEKGIREEGKEEEEEKMMGVIGIPRLSPDGLSAEVGYAILPEYWGMGYASEALILFTSYYVNSERPVQKEILTASTEPENVASERVLSKSGFRRGELVRGAFEVVDFRTGEKSMHDAEWTEWTFTRSLSSHRLKGQLDLEQDRKNILP